eukprot:5565123-Amphidinium_carterae.1
MALFTRTRPYLLCLLTIAGLANVPRQGKCNIMAQPRNQHRAIFIRLWHQSPMYETACGTHYDLLLANDRFVCVA